MQRLLSRRSGERTLPPLSLHIAANGPSRDVLELLLQSDLLDVDSMDEESMLSPLHVAAIYGRAELVEALLGYGACPFVVDNEGCTPVDRAHINGHSLCASALIVAMSEGEVSLDSAPGDLTMSQAYVTMIQADDSMGGIVDDDRVTSDKTDTLLDDDSSSKDLSVHIPDTLLQLSNDALRRKLVSMGDNPGPINSGTRPLYLRYLSKLEAGQITRKEDKQGAELCHCTLSWCVWCDGVCLSTPRVPVRAGAVSLWCGTHPCATPTREGTGDITGDSPFPFPTGTWWLFIF